MRKSIFGLLFAMLAVSASAESSYLYWTVDFNDTYDNQGPFLPQPTAGAGLYDVWLLADQGGVLSYFHTDETIQIGSGAALANIGGAVATDLSSLGTPDDYVFYVQIGQATDLDYAPVWSTAAWDYDALKTFVQADPTSPVANVWNAAVVPEPTGALLLLLGLAGLTLRRKRT